MTSVRARLTRTYWAFLTSLSMWLPATVAGAAAPPIGGSKQVPGPPPVSGLASSRWTKTGLFVDLGMANAVGGQAYAIPDTLFFFANFLWGMLAWVFQLGAVMSSYVGRLSQGLDAITDSVRYVVTGGPNGGPAIAYFAVVLAGGALALSLLRGNIGRAGKDALVAFACASLAIAMVTAPPGEIPRPSAMATTMNTMLVEIVNGSADLVATPGVAEDSPCAKYIAEFESNWADEVSGSGTAAGRPIAAQGRLLSSMWQSGFMNLWGFAQHGNDPEIVGRTVCRSLEMNAGTPAAEQHAIEEAVLGPHATGEDVNAELVYGPVLDKDSREIAINGWAMCNKSVSGGKAVFTEAEEFEGVWEREGKRPGANYASTDLAPDAPKEGASPEEACAAWWGTQTEKRDDLPMDIDDNDQALAVTSIAGQQAPVALDYFEASTGNTPGTATFYSLIALLVAILVLLSFGRIAIGAVAAYVWFVVALQLAPIALIAYALPFESTKAFGRRYGRSLVWSPIMAAFVWIAMGLLVVLSNAINSFVFSVAGGQQTIVGTLLIGATPLLVLHMFRKGAKKMGVSGAFTLTGMASMGAAAMTGHNPFQAQDRHVRAGTAAGGLGKRISSGVRTGNRLMTLQNQVAVARDRARARNEKAGGKGAPVDPKAKDAKGGKGALTGGKRGGAATPAGGPSTGRLGGLLGGGKGLLPVAAKLGTKRGRQSAAAGIFGGWVGGRLTGKRARLGGANTPSVQETEASNSIGETALAGHTAPVARPAGAAPPNPTRNSQTASGRASEKQAAVRRGVVSVGRVAGERAAAAATSGASVAVVKSAKAARRGAQTARRTVAAASRVSQRPPRPPTESVSERRARVGGATTTAARGARSAASAAATAARAAAARRNR